MHNLAYLLSQLSSALSFVMAHLKRLYVTWSVHSFVIVDNENLIFLKIEKCVYIDGFLNLGHIFKCLLLRVCFAMVFSFAELKCGSV